MSGSCRQTIGSGEARPRAIASVRIPMPVDGLTGRGR